MEQVKQRAANLLAVKSLVTIALTITFCLLSARGELSQEFNTVYLMVTAFYFGTQSKKNEAQGNA